ncbi:MAG: DnaJ domain-containing protein [Candidatus Babeliaceae bacterium]|nr:DnaJ domain-containing protein [Candidatus Babeliaceae bacterium]
MPQGQFKPQDIDAVLNSMSEEDFNNILTELSKLSPQELEELEKIGRQVLLDSGIDPDTGKPIEEKAPVSESTAQPLEAPAPINQIEQKQITRTQNPENVAYVIDTIIKQITMLRQKAQGNEQIARRITQWAEPLNDLIFFLKVINKKVHHERLAKNDFDALFKDLESLSRQLLTYQPRIILTEKNVDNDDPYKILGLSYNATSQEITTQYTKLKKKHNPKIVVKKLKKEGASKKEMDREKRAAELTLSLIQDAYDQLNDPKTKKLLDDKRLTQPTDQLSSAAQSNLTKVLEVISTAVYQNKLLEKLQDFLKKYEPEQLAQKKAFEEAQIQRKKEQVEQAKIQPKLTYTKYDRTDYPEQLPSQNKYDTYKSGGFPSMPSATTQTAPTAVPLAPIKKEEDGKSVQAGKSAGTQASSSKAKTEEEKRDEAIKKRVEEIKKQNEDKKKKETEKKQKDMQDELTKLRAEKEARQKSASNAPLKKTPVKKPLTKISDSESIDNVRTNLLQLKKVMRKDASRKLFNQMQFKGGMNPKISYDAIKDLKEQLSLEKLIQSLDALYDNLPQDTKKQQIIRREWETLVQEYSDMLSCLRKHVKEEEKKYNYAQSNEKIPEQLKELTISINDALFAFNNLSQTIVGRPTLSPELECQETLPIIKPLDQ